MRGNEMMKEKQTSGMEWMYSILNGASIAMLVAVLAAIGIMTCMAFASHADAKAKSSTNNSIGEVSFRRVTSRLMRHLAEREVLSHQTVMSRSGQR